MIGIDTNILLRLWLDDDEAQGTRIDDLLAQHGLSPGSVLVSDVVLIEALWTLAKAFNHDKHQLRVAVRTLLQEPAIAFENRHVVESALTSFEQTTCGFADCLIAAKNAALGCEFTATFDKRMRKLPGVRVM